MASGFQPKQGCPYCNMVSATTQVFGEREREMYIYIYIYMFFLGGGLAGF